MLGTTGGSVMIPQMEILWNEIRIQGHVGSTRAALTEILQLLADKKVKTIHSLYVYSYEYTYIIIKVSTWRSPFVAGSNDILHTF